MRALALAALSAGGAAMLLNGLIEGRFENHRYLGTVSLAEQPLGFVTTAVLWLLAVVLLGYFARHAFWESK